MEVALRRRLAGVADVSISQSQQTAAVTFASGTRVFSPAVFREAIAEADVDVVSLEIDVCGILDDQHVLRSSTDDQPPIVRLRGLDDRAGSITCVSGHLDERPEVPELEVTKVLQ